MTQGEFNQSELHQNAVVRLIQVIGEAARLVSDEAKTAHPEIEWHRITGMRNTIVHRYFNIDLQIVWEVVAVHLDILIHQLETLLPQDEEEE